MRLSHCMEQYLIEERQTTVRKVAHWFGLSEDRCRAELHEIEPFGVEVTADDRVLVSL